MAVDIIDAAMLLDAVASRGDPMTRFIDSLRPDLRAFAEETVRLRQELLSNVTRVLSSSDPREVAGHAAWIAQNVHDVAYRWAMLMKAVQRWTELDTESFIVRHRGGG